MTWKFFFALEVGCAVSFHKFVGWLYRADRFDPESKTKRSKRRRRQVRMLLEPAQSAETAEERSLSFSNRSAWVMQRTSHNHKTRSNSEPRLYM